MAATSSISILPEDTDTDTNSSLQETMTSSPSMSSFPSEEIPEEFLCPITLQVMNHPLMTRHGHNFERAAILGWFEQSTECPLTRRPLKPSDLISNRFLEGKIRYWREANDIPCPTEDESRFVGFIPATKAIKASASQDQMTAISLLSYNHNVTSSDAPASRPPPRFAARNQHSRRPGERRRNFLSRLLNSAVEDELPSL
jgi:hypothetical protein